MKTKKDYMKKALSLAKKAFLQGDVPIGAVIVYDGSFARIRGFFPEQFWVRGTTKGIKKIMLFAMEKF